MLKPNGNDWPPRSPVILENSVLHGVMRPFGLKYAGRRAYFWRLVRIRNAIVGLQLNLLGQANHLVGPLSAKRTAALEVPNVCGGSARVKVVVA